MKGVFHDSVPDWAAEVVHTSACIPCDLVFRDDDVIGLGMRHVANGHVCLAVEVRCPRCHRDQMLAILDRPMDVRAFVAEIALLGDIKDYYEWAVRNCTLRFYAKGTKPRFTTTHHIHTDGEGWSDPICSELRLCSKLVPTGVTMRVNEIRAFSCRVRVDHVELQVLGGYATTDAIIVLVRMETKKVRRHDGLLKLLPNHRLLQKGFEPERLEASDWSRFADLPVHAIFRLGEKTWTKMGERDLADAIGTRDWTVKRP